MYWGCSGGVDRSEWVAETFVGQGSGWVMVSPFRRSLPGVPVQSIIGACRTRNERDRAFEPETTQLATKVMLSAEGCRQRRRRLWERLDATSPGFRNVNQLVLADPVHLMYLANFHVDPFSPGAGFGR